MKAPTSPHAVLARLFAAALTLTAFGAVQAQETASGLITLEGPSGLFINPSSAVMPEGNGTAQYCIFLPENETDVIGHGLLASYGIANNLEVGVSGNYIDIDGGDSLAAIGPLAKYRLVEPNAEVPELTLGAYSQFIGDEEREKVAAFAAAYKHIPVADNGAVRSVGLHLGVRHVWFGSDTGADDELAVYAGGELELPAYMYLVGEVSNEHDNANDVPYSFGLQWRASGIAMSLAGIQNGGTDDVSFYYGVGYSGSF